MTDPSVLLPVAVFLPFAATAVIVLLGERIGHRAGLVVLPAALGSVAALAGVLGAPAVPVFDAAWLPEIDVRFALRADGFALLLAFLVAGIGAFVVLYALGYMADEERTKVRRFYAALASFMGAMLGIALSDDLILTFVFWEITSITSFLLIGYHSEEEDAKAGALMALQVTALGGLVMSVGFLLIAQVTGTFSISGITQSPELIARLLDSPLATPALLLVLAGAFTKSAQVPFHFWLPRAMVAPTPVSTYLHAATMVKAGVFLLGRMEPIFGAAPLWAPILVVVGTTSMLLGAYQAFREVDLKAILARTTAAMLGLITLLYGVGATSDASLQILNHALYKGPLFLVAGIVEHHAHTRRLDRLGGLRHALPLAFVACALASLSMAGVPPLLGFVAKDSSAAALLHSEYLGARGGLFGSVLLASLLANALFVAVAAKLTLGVFCGAAPKHGAGHDAHHAEGAPLWPAPLALVGVALALGLASAGHFTGDLVAHAASAPGPEAHVHLVPPLGAPLYLSLLALALGAALYAGRDAVGSLQERLSVLPSAPAVWQAAMAAIPKVADAFASRWQNGSLRWYLTTTVAVVPLLSYYALSRVGLSWRAVGASFTEMPWYGFLFCVLLAIATVIATRARTRLTAVIAMTSVGFFVAMLFVVYRSPDILLTQVLIETVSTIFVLLVLIFLPAFPDADLRPPSRLLNAAVAGAFGLTITLLLLLAMSPGIRETDNIAVRPGGLLSLALAEGGGQNAVNVIIVDIRAPDTTGEITVVMMVGLCVYGLLRTRRERSRAARRAAKGGP